MRTCQIDEAGNYVDCTGSLQEIEECQTQPCPGNFTYSGVCILLLGSKHEA